LSEQRESGQGPRRHRRTARRKTQPVRNTNEAPARRKKNRAGAPGRSLAPRKRHQRMAAAPFDARTQQGSQRGLDASSVGPRSEVRIRLLRIPTPGVPSRWSALTGRRKWRMLAPSQEAIARNRSEHPGRGTPTRMPQTRFAGSAVAELVWQDEAWQGCGHLGPRSARRRRSLTGFGQIAPAGGLPLAPRKATA
jgi:hypothetical protein